MVLTSFECVRIIPGEPLAVHADNGFQVREEIHKRHRATIGAKLDHNIRITTATAVHGMTHEIAVDFFVDYAIGEAFGTGKHEMVDEGEINEDEQKELQFERSAWDSAITAMLTERKKWEIYDVKYIIDHSKVIMCGGDTSGHVGQGATIFFRRVADAIVTQPSNLCQTVSLANRIVFLLRTAFAIEMQNWHTKKLQASYVGGGLPIGLRAELTEIEENNRQKRKVNDTHSLSQSSISTLTQSSTEGADTFC
jgi:hypothetical protein